MPSRPLSGVPAEASPYARHLPALDGIRGLAAMAVVCSHVFPGTPHGAAQSGLVHLLQFGANGVDLFFVLSGFLITGILYDSLNDRRFFRKFYARRALRIFPLYYGVLLVFLLAARVQHSDYNGQLLAAALYVQNTYLLAKPVWLASGKLTLPLSHFWSLAIEEQFYLMWPLLMFLLRRRSVLLLFCAGSLVLCPLLRLAALRAGVPIESIHANTFTRADSLLAGAALALLLRSRWHDVTLRLAPALLAAGLVLVVFETVWAITGSKSTVLLGLEMVGAQYTALAMAAAGLIGCGLSRDLARTILSWEPLRGVGKYSYGLYVYHLLVFEYLSAPLRGWLAHHVSANKMFGVLGGGLLVFATSFILAYVSYQLWEKQFLRLKKYFDYRPHVNTVIPG